MNHNEQEIEAKFYVQDLPAVEESLRGLGGQLVQERVFERNLRFDDPAGTLMLERRVLRLRQPAPAGHPASAGVLTYKSPMLPGQEVSTRTEIEVIVSDLVTAQHLLEALGYHVAVMYEKWRTTYHLGPTEVVLDELPYGNFVEIEGRNLEEIRSAARQLDLAWKARIPLSYLGLFEQLRLRGLQAEHLSFEELRGHYFSADDLDVTPAD